MKNLKTILLLLSCTLLFNTSCDKEETSVEQEIIEQSKEEEEKEPEEEEEKEEEEEPEEETPDNPDLDLLGGQGAFTITPGSGIMSGETSVRLRIVFDDTQIQIPNDSLEYRVDWKTNGIYGSLTDNLKESSISDGNNIIYTSTNTETNEGEEKFVATLYSRPKGSSEEFTLKGSALATISIANEPNKKYLVLGASYWLRDSWAEAGGTRNFFNMGYSIPYDEDAVLYQLQINEIIYGGFPYEQNSGSTWTNASQPQFTYLDDEPNVYRVWLLSNSTNTINQPTYDINYYNTVNVSGTAQLTITYENN